MLAYQDPVTSSQPVSHREEIPVPNFAGLKDISYDEDDHVDADAKLTNLRSSLVQNEISFNVYCRGPSYAICHFNKPWIFLLLYDMFEQN